MIRMKEINEYIFAPFNTFTYIIDDKLLFGNISQLQAKMMDNLNNEPVYLDKQKKYRLQWECEQCLDFKLSKGVFAPPGRDVSCIMACLVHDASGSRSFPIPDEISDVFSAGSLHFNDVRFYFYESGVGTCSAWVKLEHPDGIDILQLEAASERLNELFKSYFEEIAYELTVRFVNAVKRNEIRRLVMDFLPDVKEVDRQKNFIPWTHRIYHVHDHPDLISMKNPGEPFRTLVTPTRQMDINDFSIYDNRYIYFGWGHSLIFTKGGEDGYSQTSRPVTDYVRLVEIAQAKWQFLDVLSDILHYSVLSFNRLFSKMNIQRLQKTITMIRGFRNAIERILADFRGIKITFDTEKRILLDELHDRWLTSKLMDRLDYCMQQIEDFLEELYQRQKEQREESLNVIALLFTILGAIEVIDLFIGVFEPQIAITTTIKVIILIVGTVAVAMMIMAYLRLSTRG
ncbi:hypothetical protein GF325_11980 [Candidatus Bathyarchaeota archaeon]|nr:hypothetical protein [Candidatus Bathyarchaeota archaeon]